METTVKIPNREIALAAFDRLRREQRKDAALRLAGCMLRGTYISLGIGDTDWEIDTALTLWQRTDYNSTLCFNHRILDLPFGVLAAKDNGKDMETAN